MRSTESSIIPGLRYEDLESAIAFLQSAFGFADGGVFRDEQGRVMHAQLTFHGGMVMLGPDGSPDMKESFSTPKKLGGKSTQAVYVVVEDADQHLDRAKRAGVEIIKPLADADYGGRGYTCRDAEGHIWEFGTYDPWKK